MAYMNQDKKRVIKAALEKVVPKGWKYTLSVHHHSTICMTILSAPVDLLAAAKEQSAFNASWKQHEDHLKDATTVDINVYHPSHYFKDALLDTIQSIIVALNTGNHDRSDIMTDYFDVGHYVSLSLGKWNKPFVCTA